MCDRLTSAFVGIDYGFDQLNYYLFSTEIQQILPIIMMNTQKPVVFQCFGTASMCRESFKKVIHACVVQN